MACRAEEIGLNRSADFAAACPSQQRAVGGPTTKLAVAGDRGFESISLRVDEPVKQHADRDKVLFYGRLGCCALYFARSVSPTATSNVRRDRSRESMRQGRPLQRCLHTTARVGPSLASTGGSTRCSALHYSADPPGFCFLILPQPLRGCSIRDLRTKSSMPLECGKVCISAA